MKLALIFNPFKYKMHEENLRIVQKYFGLFPPLSLAWAAAIAEKAGHTVRIIDARTLGLSPESTIKLLRKFKPDALGFMVTTYMFPDTLQWIKAIKKQINVPVIVGGYNLRVYPQDSIAHEEIDFGIIEQAYYTLPALLIELEKGTKRFAKVPGLAFKENGRIIITEHPQKIIFDEFPNPARHLLPNELYAEFPTERKNFTVMITSLGCPFECVFCEAGRTEYNARSPQTVIKEIEECYHDYSVREIDIFDYEFTGIRARVSEICRLLIEKKLDIVWSCRSRVDTVDEELLKQMYTAGCRRIYFGVESGVQDILDRMNKKQKIRQIIDTIKCCRKLGVKTLGFFLVGAPGDTKKTIRKTLNFAKKLDLDYVQFSKCLAKPKTELWEELVKKEKKDYWQDWILGKVSDAQMSRPWTELSNEQIDKLTKWAYISYYLRFRFIIKALFNIGSWYEFKRKLCALIDMIFSQESLSRVDDKFYAFNENSEALILKARNNLENSMRCDMSD
ncbi:MAG: B12-binding domain-containing radical SAM protein [Candidatus Omnitrophica bacterium]|nr:B12-binding domain-containing radical SAM protein [Candidatus Omnitrophota bacterium]